MTSITTFAWAQKKQQPCDDPFIRGNNYILDSDLGNARNEFESSIKKDPNNAKAFYGLGVVSIMENNTDEAIKHLTKSIMLDNKFVLAYLQRGQLYYYQGDLVNSYNDLKKVVDLKPDLPFPFFILGSIESSKANYDQAILYFDNVIRLNPKDANAYLSKGVCLGYQGEYSKAINLLTKAIDLNPRNAMAYIHRGSLEVECKLLTEACKDFHKAQDLGYSATSYINAYCTGKN